MKATSFLTLALLTTVSAAPRIEQISPATGRIDGTPIAYDLDNDGDLEVSQDLVNWNRMSTASPTIESTEGIWSKVSLEIPRSRSKSNYRIPAIHDPRR
ncbi:MAG: hypothetical protein ACI9NQ_000881 [Paracoccaceae bacterium]|jgi:hypothetical protein